MAKIDKVQEVAIKKLRPYERNAKIHGREQIEKLKASIQEFGFLTPCLIDGDFNIIAGHGRVMAASEIGMEKVPCVFIEGLDEAQRRAYILADNRLGELGEWDMEIVFDELEILKTENFNIDLTGFDLEVRTDWFKDRERFDDSRQEGNDDYNEFLDKFEQPKTTDDCYTPDNIYEVIAEYVEERYHKSKKDFVRPFYPGGDYQNEIYDEGSVVVDNPPFSILAEIVDWYVDRNMPFFLFCPALSCLGYVTRKNVTALVVGTSITYENGARVQTSFLTNMDDPQVASRTDPELFQKIDAEDKKNLEKLKANLPKYDYPNEVATSSMLQYLSKYGQYFEIRRDNSAFIRQLDAQKEYGKAIYGNAFLLSPYLTAQKVASEQNAQKVASEIASEIASENEYVWELSEREKNIVQELGKRDKEGNNV